MLRHEVMERCSTEDCWEETFVDGCINAAGLMRAQPKQGHCEDKGHREG